MRLKWASFVFLLFSPPSFAFPKDGGLTDRIIAVVEGRVITLSDLRLENELKTLSICEFSPMQEHREEDGMKFLIELQVLRHLAGDNPLYRPTNDEINRRISSMLAHWNNEDEYMAFKLKHGLDDAKVRTNLQTMMIAESYAKRKLGVAKGESEEELQRRYNEWITDQITSVHLMIIQEISPEAN
jgi:hypothetical protein